MSVKKIQVLREWLRLGVKEGVREGRRDSGSFFIGTVKRQGSHLFRFYVALALSQQHTTVPSEVTHLSVHAQFTSACAHAITYTIEAAHDTVRGWSLVSTGTSQDLLRI